MDPSSDHHGAADKPPLLADAAPPGTSSVTSSSAPARPLIPAASELAVSMGDAKAALGKPRGKRTTLSLHEKFIVKTFCDQQVSESKARADFVPSHDALRQEIANKFGWEVGRSTLSKIMCMDWQQLQVQAHPNPNMKRKRKPLFPAFEEDLVKAMRAHLGRHDGIAAQLLPDDTLPGGGSGARSAPVLTEAFIMEEAQRLKQQHGIKDEELVLSVGWLARFKHRNGIRLRKGTITTMESGDAAMAPSSSSLPMTLQFSDLTSKRPKKNALGAPGRWPMSFQIPSPYTSSGIDQPVPALASLSDLRTTCAYHATASGDASDPVDVVPSSLLHGIPAAVQSFCCPNCPVSLPTGVEGLHVAVIGFNCTRDAFLAAALVGEHGSVTCFEANPVAFATAEEHTDAYTVKTLGYASSNLRVLNLAAFDHSANSAFVARHDLAFFNCSFQGAAHKALLLEVAFNLLLEGGECRLSYVSSTRRLQSLPSLHQASPSLAIDDLVSASVYVEDFRRMCQHVGFLDPRCLRVNKFQDHQGAEVHHHHHHQDMSVTTARLFKLGLVEDRPEDYGERATYIGGAGPTDTPTALVYPLDAQFTFMRDVSMAIDGNTSQILRLSWLKRFFNVEGDRMTHRGRFTYTL